MEVKLFLFLAQLSQSSFLLSFLSFFLDFLSFFLDFLSVFSESLVIHFIFIHEVIISHLSMVCTI
jgi:hypothetical protein